MGEKDKDLTEIKDKQEQFAKAEEEQEKRLADYAKQLQANPELREDEAFVAEMIKDFPNSFNRLILACASSTAFLCWFSI